MGGVEPATVFALLRACMAGDEAGVAAIIGTADPVALTLALAAWCNENAIAWFGRDGWDQRLAECIEIAAGVVE